MMATSLAGTALKVGAYFTIFSPRPDLQNIGFRAYPRPFVAERAG